LDAKKIVYLLTETGFERYWQALEMKLFDLLGRPVDTQVETESIRRNCHRRVIIECELNTHINLIYQLLFFQPHDEFLRRKY